MAFVQIGTAFVQHYYNFFSTQRQQLAGIYRPHTLLTWQSEQIQGAAAIMERFNNLGFSEAVFRTTNVDCQPTITGGVLVAVNGEVQLKGEAHMLSFSDVFILAEDNGQWYVSNQVFNILGGGSH